MVWFVKNIEVNYKKNTLLFVLALAALFTALANIRSYASDSEIERIYLGEPEYAYWETDTIGRWDKVDNAHEYQVKLFIADEVERDETNWKSFDIDDPGLETVLTIRTTAKSYDFREYMDDFHTYFFAVRAVPKQNEQAYVEEGGWIASKNADYRVKTVMGITDGKWRNYLEGSKYETADGAMLGEGWHLIQGYWYLMDKNGYRLTGWQETETGWYYMNEDGIWIENVNMDNEA